MCLLAISALAWSDLDGYSLGLGLGWRAFSPLAADSRSSIILCDLKRYLSHVQSPRLVLVECLVIPLRYNSVAFDSAASLPLSFITFSSDIGAHLKQIRASDEGTSDMWASERVGRRHIRYPGPQVIQFMAVALFQITMRMLDMDVKRVINVGRAKRQKRMSYQCSRTKPKQRDSGCKNIII